MGLAAFKISYYTTNDVRDHLRGISGPVHSLTIKLNRYKVTLSRYLDILAGLPLFRESEGNSK